MENQHRKISGYRELSQTEVDLMNEIKAFGPQLEALTNRIASHIGDQYDSAQPTKQDSGDRYGPELQRLIAADPMFWKGKGTHALQEGLMFLTRAVAQPTFF